MIMSSRHMGVCLNTERVHRTKDNQPLYCSYHFILAWVPNQLIRIMGTMERHDNERCVTI